MFNLNSCTQDCKKCILHYKNKHKLKKGDKFKISCKGIPTEYIPESVLSSMPGDPNLIIGTQDPVTWASTMLDWHCIDPDGEHWKRKHEQGTLGDLPRYKEFQAKAGHSVFHRPYQAIMMRCSGKYKVFRCGRQIGKTTVLSVMILWSLYTQEDFQVTLIAPYQSQIDLVFDKLNKYIRSNPILHNSVLRNVKAPQYTIQLKNGSKVIGFSCIAGTKVITSDGHKNIEDIKEGDRVLSLNENDNSLLFRIVTYVYKPNYKQVYKVTLFNGYEVTVSDDHPFWVKQKNNYSWQKLKALDVEKQQVAYVATHKHKENYEACLNKCYKKGDLEKDVFFSRIRSIESLGYRDTYDIKVGDGSNSFIANNIVLHNTAGTRSGGDAGAARGQSGGMLCFKEGTLVNTEEFAIRPIESFTLQNTIFGADRQNTKVGDIVGLYKRPADVICITNPLGKVYCTPDHPMFDGEKDIPAEQAEKVVMSLAHQWLSFKNENIIARLAGYNVGDGWITSKNQIAGFAGSSNDLQQICEDIVYLGGERCHPSERISENKEAGIIGTVSQIASVHAGKLLKDICPRGVKVHQQLSIPDQILNGSTCAKRNYVSGLYSAEGTTIRYQKNGFSVAALEIGMTSSKKEYIEKWIKQVADLIEELGIKISKVWTFKIEKERLVNKQKEDRWKGMLRIASSRENTLNFINTIGSCYSVDKRQKFNEYKIWCWYLNIYNTESWKKNRKIRRLDLSTRKIAKKINLPSSTVKYHKHLYDPLFSEDKLNVRQLINRLTVIKSGYVLLPLSKLNRPKRIEATVYNLTSTAYHRYFGDGFLSHNCFDEADMLSKNDIDAALSIITNFPDATVWMSSTPTGRRENFYKACNSRDWREYFYPSHVNPNWTEETDSLYKGMLTEEGYRHEVLGEWGDQEEGVYQAKYVEAAQSDYEYEDCVRQKPTGDPKNDYLYSIGVDWNDTTIGVAIAVVEWDPRQGLFRVVDKHIMAKSEYTQIKGCQKIVELNRIWTPFAIYADAGFGATQAEILKLAGHNAIRKNGKNSPDAVFTRIFKKYQFGGSIETRDPFTKQPVKKQGKAFLVENSVRRFEQSIIKYPRSDEKYTAALHGYIIKSISQAGVPIYKEENETAGDHFLDAVNLALVGFMLEKTEFGNPNFSTDIARTGPLGLSEALPSDKQPQDRTAEISSVNPTSSQAPPSRQMPGRTNRIIEEQPSIPGAHLQVDKTGVRLWAHPGFERDEPAPAVRTRREAFKQAGERTGQINRRIRTPPKRKMF